MKYVALFVMTLLAGCNMDPVPTQPERATSVANQVSYSKDQRTGLCYAYMWKGGGYGGPVFTYVPCTPEVESILKYSRN